MKFNNENFTKETPLTAIFKENKNSSLKTLIKIYKGNYKNLALSAFFFILKHTPAWVLPIVMAQIVNIASYPKEHELIEIGLYVAIMIVFISINIPTNYIHTKLYSKSIRSVEAKLRGNLVDVYNNYHLHIIKIFSQEDYSQKSCEM